MKKNLILLLVLFVLSCNGNNTIDTEEVIWTITPSLISFSGNGETKSLSVKSNGDWSVSSDEIWCTVSPNYNYKGTVSLTVKVAENPTNSDRTTNLIFKSGEYNYTYKITQNKGNETTYNPPAGYTLVWQDEFNDGVNGKSALPNTSKWWYETGNGGWGNNELEYYVPGKSGLDTCALVSNGTLKIIAKKVGSYVFSIRMNSAESWTYGYFQARIKMPSGKGTWPAFWMLPQNFTSWPLDGEIDIMEYVGYDPNMIHATIHTNAYNHTLGTQKTATKTVANAESTFHVYALEWTSEKIVGYIDGVAYFTFLNDGKGDINTWPFNKPFYLKLNLAWGGAWGGAQGVDETVLPAIYEIDYVRVFQK